MNALTPSGVSLGTAVAPEARVTVDAEVLKLRSSSAEGSKEAFLKLLGESPIGIPPVATWIPAPDSGPALVA